MKKKIIFIIVTILAIILIALGVVLYTNGSNNDNKNGNSDGNIIDASKVDTDPTKSSNQMSVGLPDSNNYKNNKDGSMTNTSANISKKHTSGDLVISNMSISLPKDEEFFVDYVYTIKNTGSTDYSSLPVSIVFIFADNSKLTSSAYTIDSLPAGKSVKVERREYISVLGAVDYDIKIGDSE